MGRKSQNRNQMKLIYRRIIFAAFVLAVLVGLFTFSFWVVNKLSGGNIQPDAAISYAGDVPIYEDFLDMESMARTGEKREIKYIVIHETDNVNEGADAKAHNEFIHSNGAENELSWHYTVDDHEIWHHLPDDETAFHAGDHMEDDGGNKNGIGIEMCVNEDGDFEKTLDNAEWLAATLIYEYNLDIDDLKKHQDFSGKACPATLLKEDRWDEFTDNVQTKLDTLKQSENT